MSGPDEQVKRSLPIGDYQVVPRTATVTGGPVSIVKGDARRIALIFSTNDATGGNLFPNTTVSNTVGIRLNVTTGFWMIEWGKHGTLPMQEWFAFASPGPWILSWIEVLYIKG